MNLSGLSNSQIEQAIEKMQKGIEIKPNSPEAVELQTSIDRALEELQRRAQKKSDAQSILASATNPSLGIPSLNETPEKLAADREKQTASKTVQQNQRQEQSTKAFEPDRRVIAKIENPEPLTVPVVEIEFKDAKGNVYTRALDQTDILTLLKTYFKRVATSAKMEGKRYSEAYNSDMGKTVYKLFQGWNIIYNETEEGTAWPPLADVFPGLSRASQQQKVNAEILWRWASNDK